MLPYIQVTRLHRIFIVIFKKQLLHNTLLHRVLLTCKNEHTNFIKYLLDQSYVNGFVDGVLMYCIAVKI